MDAAQEENEARLVAWMAATQRGDGVAYELLLRELAERARRLVRILLRDDRDLEDVVQEILLAVHKARHTYDPARPFLPWFHAIARHRAADMRRWRFRRDVVEISDDIALMNHPAVAAAEAAEIPEELQRALAALPQKQREVVRKLKLEGRSVREVAAESGLSEANVKVIAHRAYERMRRTMGNADEDR